MAGQWQSALQTRDEVDPQGRPDGAAVSVRPMRRDDAEACGHVGFAAHGAVAASHNVPSEQPSVEFAFGLVAGLMADPAARGFLAERGGRPLGSVFLHAYPPMAGVGPLTVDPGAQGGVGRRLMEAALGEARRLGLERVRLVQSPSHLRSLALYVRVGFEVREPLVLVQGQLRVPEPVSPAVREMTEADVAACNAVCRRVHGLEREHELRRAMAQGVATVAERGDGVVAYAAGLGFLGHAVAQEMGDLKALITAAPAIIGPGFFVPTRNGAILRWLLDGGMRMAWPATLMSLGPYQEPAGAFLPSIAF